METGYGLLAQIMEIILYANDIWIVGGYMGGAWTIPKMEQAGFFVKIYQKKRAILLNMLMDYGLHVQLMVAMTDIAIRTEYIFDVVYLLILYRIVKEIK